MQIPGLGNINQIVCKAYGISEEQLYQHTCNRLVSEARYVAMYCDIKINGSGINESAYSYGLSHSTLIYGLHRLEERNTYDKAFRAKFDAIKQQLNIL